MEIDKTLIEILMYEAAVTNCVEDISIYDFSQPKIKQYRNELPNEEI